MKPRLEWIEAGSLSESPHNRNRKTKRCSRCQKEKPRTAFYRAARSNDGLYCYCRSCAALYRDTWRAQHPLINVYMGMMARCYAPTCDAFQNYGARGIQVCGEWRNNFPAFEAWALTVGYRPGVHLDRRDNDGAYAPENCRFVTPSQNHRNKRPAVKLTALLRACLQHNPRNTNDRTRSQPHE